MTHDPLPPAFIAFFDWFSSSRWDESEFPDPLDWQAVGTTLAERGTTEFYRAQFAYIRKLGIEGVAWSFTAALDEAAGTSQFPSSNAIDAARASGLKIAPYFDVSGEAIRPDGARAVMLGDAFAAFSSQVPSELVARDRRGDAVLFLYGLSFDEAGTDPEAWSAFGEDLIARVRAFAGDRFKIYWSCTNRPFQEHLFLHFRRHFVPFHFVLDTPQSQFGHECVTWNFGYDSLHALEKFGSTRALRIDPRYVEEPAWLAATTDPAAIFIYGWNQPFEGSFLFPSHRYGENKALVAAHYLSAPAESVPKPLPRVLLIVDDLAAAFGDRKGDWHLEMLREMLLYRFRLFAPQADVRMPAEVDEATFAAYEGVIDATSVKDPRVVAMVRARWDRMPTIVFEPSRSDPGYIDDFLKHTTTASLNDTVSISEIDALVFVRDDVHHGIPLSSNTVHLRARTSDGRALPFVISNGPAVFVNSYGNSEAVMRVAFELFYGRPMGSSILYGEGLETQRLEESADGTIVHKRLSRASIDQRWRMPSTLRLDRLPPRLHERHAAFAFGLEDDLAVAPIETLEFTGERYVPWLSGQIRYEHVHRYESVLAFCANKRVLDIACGEGYGAALLARYASAVVGVDIDEGTIAHAARTYAGANLRFVASSALSLPLDAGSVDVAVCFETLEHFVEHDEFVAEIKRVLAPGGVFFVSSPNKRVYSELLGFQNPYHPRELYRHELEALTCGSFANVRIYGQQIAAVSHLRPMEQEANAAALLRPSVPFVEALEAPDPTYFIAVCSDASPLPSIASIFLDDAHFLLRDLNEEVTLLRKQLAASQSCGERPTPRV